MRVFIKNQISNCKYLIFIFFEKYLKIHITKVHYYSPIPEISKIDKKNFETHNNILIDLNEDKHTLLFEKFEKYICEYTPMVNPGLSTIDSINLFCMIRHDKPEKIVEIGSGYSTKIILLAINKNEKDGFPCKLIAIEPYPKKFLRDINSSNFSLIEDKIQNVDHKLISDTDILFIDSTHVSKFQSDVNTEIFQIIPTLKIGTLIHWHDIMIPGDYPESWVKHGNKFWNETYLVHAFMLYNESFEVIWGSKYMQMFHPHSIKKFYKDINLNDANEQLSSFWVKRVK